MHSNRLDLENAALPGLLRRLSAMLYDSVLVMALVAAAFTLVYLPLAMGLGLEDLRDYPLLKAALGIWMLVVAVSFHLWFWTHGGQTLGMRAWRLMLFSEDGGPVTLRQALARYLTAVVSLAAFGLGYLWILLDKQKRSWHDLASHTRLFLVDSNKT